LVAQGLITQAGYQEQANSYGIMAATAQTTAAGETNIAGEEEQIANQQRQLAAETQQAGGMAELGDFAASALKGAAAIATMVVA